MLPAEEVRNPLLGGNLYAWIFTAPGVGLPQSLVSGIPLNHNHNSKDSLFLLAIISLLMSALVLSCYQEINYMNEFAFLSTARQAGGISSLKVVPVPVAEGKQFNY